MAFVVQCPFCQLRAKVPDRAIGGLGQCPKCANSFTLASVDDQHLPEADTAPSAEVEPVPASAIGAAIAVAAANAAVNEPTPAYRPPPSGFQPADAAGALALLLGGVALIGGSLSALHGFVLPLCGLGLLTGLTAIIAACLSAQRRLLLPIAGSAASGAMLIIVWFFPALLGPAYEHARQRPAPVPRGLHAIPLAGAPTLAEMPKWVDAKLYALQRDGLRVEVVRVSLLPAANDAKAKERLLVRVRVSLDRADAKPLLRKDNPMPTLSDDTGKPFPLRLSEFFDRGGGTNKPGLFPLPTFEETFAFDAPAPGWKNLRLELPAARWAGNDVFRFTIAKEPRMK